MNLLVPQKLSNTHLLFLQNILISRFLNDSQMNAKPRHHLSFLHSPLSLISVDHKFDLSRHIIHLSVIQAFYDFSPLQSIARNNFLYSVQFFFSFPFLLTSLHIGIMTPWIQETSSFWLESPLFSWKINLFLIMQEQYAILGKAVGWKLE